MFSTWYVEALNPERYLCLFVPFVAKEKWLSRPDEGMAFKADAGGPDPFSTYGCSALSVGKNPFDVMRGRVI